MSRIIGCIGGMFIALWLVAGPSPSQAGDAADLAPGESYPGEEWVRVSPEAVGWSVEGRESAIDFARKLGSHALLVVFDGVQDYRVEDGEYAHEEVSLHPAYQSYLSARDLARFGLLYLREGRWGDHQMVPATWVQQSTKTHVEAATPYTGSQMLVVAPDHRLVIAHLEETPLGQPGIQRRKFWQLYAMILGAAPKNAN